METITLKSGEALSVERIVDYMTTDDEKYSVAYNGDDKYTIVDRGFYGPIWDEAKWV